MQINLYKKYYNKFIMKRKNSKKNILTTKSLSTKKKSIYSQVLEKITPTKEDLREEKKLFEKIKLEIEELEGNHSHLEWCGSSARGTHLKGDRDLDLFVMFDEKMSEDELEKEGLRIGESVFDGHKWEKAYSQHPYIRGVIHGFDVEIVPGYIVKSGAEKKSAVDRTPFHNKYLLRRLSAKQKQEVRLLKQFLKGIRAYGADLKNCSLPGYGVELLVLEYGNFEKVLKGIGKWKLGKHIKLNNKKGAKSFDDPLVLIDPVDPNRNVAAALSPEQFERMVFASKLFLKKPSKKFFFSKEKKLWTKNRVKKMFKKKELIAVRATFPQKVLADIVWGQLRRFLRKLATQLKENDFTVLRENLWSDEKDIYYIFELESLELQKAKKVIGPKVSDEENVERFLANKKKLLSGPRIEKGRVVVEIERKEVRAEKVLTKFLKSTRKEERNAIKTSLKKAKVLSEKDLLKVYKGDFAEYFSNYLEGKELFE
jgi:tRNA nucleotidyltransferase (CCA-adding enzyme)